MHLKRLLLAGLSAATFGLSPPSAGGGIDGYLSARFGMSPQEVLATLARDGVTFVSQETQGDELVILAKRVRNGIESEVIYLLPGTQRLAMVVEFFPGLTAADALERELTERYGSPLSAAHAREVLAQMGEEPPAEVTRLTLWADRQQGVERLVRLLRFADHMAVEYLDATQMGSLD